MRVPAEPWYNEPNDHGSGPGAARRCHVNTVFQDYALFPHMTVAQNIEYGLRVRHVPKAELRPGAHPAVLNWAARTGQR